MKIEKSERAKFADLLGKETNDDHAKYINEHVRLLIEDAGFVEGISVPIHGFNMWQDLKLTWSGHDYLDSVRDPKIWEQTKKTAETAGGFTVEILGALAKGLIKEKIKKHTGVEIDM